jgi:hypothetical protein
MPRLYGAGIRSLRRSRISGAPRRADTVRAGLQERVRRVVLHRIRDTHTILANQWRHECDANISIIARDLSSARFIGGRSASPASSPIAGLARRLPAFMSFSAVRSNPRRSTRGLPISRRSSNSPRPRRAPFAGRRPERRMADRTLPRCSRPHRRQAAHDRRQHGQRVAPFAWLGLIEPVMITCVHRAATRSPR